MAERLGTVFIAVDIEPGDPEVRFVGYWDRGRQGDIVEMPGLRCAAEAIQWGLARADDVRIRFDGCGYWWAGLGSMPEPTEPDDEGFMGTVSLRR